MSGCGNRMKARRHYHRTAETETAAAAVFGSVLPDWLEALGRHRPGETHSGRLSRIRRPHVRDKAIAGLIVGYAAHTPDRLRAAAATIGRVVRP